MISIRKSLIYFLLFVMIASYLAYRITNAAYDSAYDYDDQYGYAIGNTDTYTPDPAR